MIKNKKIKKKKTLKENFQWKFYYGVRHVNILIKTKPYLLVTEEGESFEQIYKTIFEVPAWYDYVR